MGTTSRTLCSFCDAGCSLLVEHDGGTVLSVRGDRGDPFSRGHVCPKGAAVRELHHDPDRVREPLRRQGERWTPVGWQEALGEIGERIVRLRREHGRNAVGFYYGTPVGHNYATLLSLLPFMRLLGSRSLFSASSLDALPRMLVSLLLYGNQALLPVPDLDRTDLLLVIGANPAVSQGSALTAPDCARRLRELRARGARLWVIDPRRSETAELADRHWFIRPGTDGWLLLGMVHVLFAEKLVRLGSLEGLVDGLDEVRAVSSDFPPERAAAMCGIGAEAIRELARAFAAAPSAACYGRMGTCTQRFGTLVTWGIDVLNVLTGNLDRPGGAMFCTPAADLAGFASRFGQTGAFGRWRSRATGLPEFNGELPVAALGAEIDTPGNGQVRGLLCLAGNPVLSHPHGNRLERSLAGLELLVCIDFYLNETSRHAHFLLPAPSPLEHEHFPLLEQTFAIRNVARYAAAALPRSAGTRQEWEILFDVLDGIGRAEGGARGALGRLGHRASHLIGPDRALDLLLRLGPHRLTLERLRQAPHGLDLGSLAPRLGPSLRARRRRLRLLPDLVRHDLGRLAAATDGAPAGLLLVSRRTLRSNTSWMHNLPSLVRGRTRCVLEMHPNDAAARGLEGAKRVQIRTATGRLTLPLVLTARMMPGVVSMPFGWGHHRPGTRMAVATGHAGVSMNDLLDETLVDAASGTSVLDGIPVEVERPEEP